MLAFIDRRFARREVVVALARDFKIFMWERRHLGRNETPVEAGVKFMKGLLKKRREPEAAVELQAQLAYTEVATQELVEA
jgi:hypothetical protein